MIFTHHYTTVLFYCVQISRTKTIQTQILYALKVRKVSPFVSDFIVDIPYFTKKLIEIWRLFSVDTLTFKVVQITYRKLYGEGK